MLLYENLSGKDKQLAQIVCHLTLMAGRPLYIKEILSLIYLADRDHLRRCGRPISNGYSKKYYSISKTLPPVEKNMLNFLNHILENGGLK